MMADHTSVVNSSRRYSPKINPYYLGFHMFKDIERICKDPNDSDREYFPDIAGKKDKWLDIIKNAAYSYHDESFIRQFLSPTLLKDLKISILRDDSNQEYYECIGSQELEYYEQTKNALAATYNIIDSVPQMEIHGWNKEEKKLKIGYIPYKDRGVTLGDSLKWIERTCKAVTGVELIFTGQLRGKE